MQKRFDTSYQEHDRHIKRARHGRIWGAEELSRLVQLFRTGYGLQLMCETLERPAAGILPKLQSLSLIVYEQGTGRYYYRGSTKVDPFTEDLHGYGSKLVAAWVQIDEDGKSTVIADNRRPKSQIVYWDDTIPNFENIHIHQSNEEIIMSNIAKTPVIETRTYIYGTDATQMSDEQIFTKIAELEGVIARWEKVQNRPKKLQAVIENTKADIKKLADFVDSRE